MVGEGAAGGNAILHAIHLLAGMRARFANLGAESAGLTMKLALMRHQIRGQGAY